MKTKLLFLAILTVLFLVACSEETKESTPDKPEVIAENKNNNAVITNDKQEEAKQKPTQTNDGLKGMVMHFENNGYSIGEKSVKAFEMVGANDGFAIEVNGTKVEFYLYDLNSEALKEIQSTGQYDMDGFVIDAVSNGNIVMMAHQFHPEKDNIIGTFNSYK